MLQKILTLNSLFIDMPNFKNELLIFTLTSICLLSACKDDDVPEIENEEEVITDIRLTFNPQEGNHIIFTAADPDGEGPEDIESSSAITLMPNTTYDLFIEFENTIAGVALTEEIRAEGEEHQLFFGFSDGLFENPAGNGNLDTPENSAVIYADEDSTGLPIGLITSWRTGDGKSGEFRLVLKHQPGSKSATSGATIGSTDVDVSWQVVIE